MAFILNFHIFYFTSLFTTATNSSLANYLSANGRNFSDWMFVQSPHYVENNYFQKT